MYYSRSYKYINCARCGGYRVEDDMGDIVRKCSCGPEDLLDAEMCYDGMYPVKCCKCKEIYWCDCRTNKILLWCKCGHESLMEPDDAEREAG